MAEPLEAEAIGRLLTQCADEYVARAVGGEPWELGGEVFDVDEDVTDGPVELVRRADGARFCADTHVVVWRKDGGDRG